MASQVGQIPQNILTLLQTYGPLTVAEITDNIPPTDLPIPTILEIMRALNVIHYHELQDQEDDDHDKKEDSGSTEKDNNDNVDVNKKGVDGHSHLDNDKNLKGYYYFHDGEIRSDVIYPSEIIDTIHDTENEINETMERIQLLKEELKQNVSIANRARSAREFLKNLVAKYGGEKGIRGDPVYATALKTLNVDLGMKRKMAVVESVKTGRRGRKRRKNDEAMGTGPSLSSTTAITTDSTATGSLSPAATVAALSSPPQNDEVVQPVAVEDRSKDDVPRMDKTVDDGNPNQSKNLSCVHMPTNHATEARMDATCSQQVSPAQEGASTQPPQQQIQQKKDEEKSDVSTIPQGIIKNEKLTESTMSETKEPGVGLPLPTGTSPEISGKDASAPLQQPKDQSIVTQD